MVNFPCLICETTVGINYNVVCYDICDRWVHIRDFKKDQTPWFCKSCIWKEIPFSSLNDTEFAHLSKGISVLPKIKEKLPTTIFRKLNVCTENMDMKSKYYKKDKFKELGFDKNNDQMSFMHLNIFFALSYWWAH